MSFNNHLEDEDKPYKKKKERDMEILRTMMENKARFDKEKAEDSAQSDASSIIDWDDIDDTGAAGSSSLWADHPPVEKLFYTEKAHISKMSKEEVDAWRQENHEMKIDYVPKNKETAPKVQIPNPCLSFTDAFSDHPEILKTIQKQGFEKPSPIQSQFWPCVLQGHDTIGIAQTGTGKTLAFLMPMFIHIDKQQTPLKQRKGPSALILSPTRELALQIESEILKYKYRGLRVACVYGGGNKGIQLRAIASGVEIIVATPGRMNDLLNQGMISLEDVTYVVLDEADRMLDMGFEPQILKILLEIRKDRQTIMTSATWPKGVRSLVKSYMIDPLQVVVGSLDLTGVNTVAQNIRIVETDGTLDYQGNPQYKNNKMKELKQICTKMFDKSKDKMIIFVATKRGADNLCHKINMKMAHDSRRPIADAIHGDRSQKEREYTLSRFREGRMKIMVATDVASRGIDVQDVTFVVNYDFPGNVEEYVHRIGRTGRAGQKGTAISFFTRDNQTSAKELIEILKKTPGTEIPSELVRYAQDSRRPSKNSKNKMQFRTGSLHEQRSFRKY